MPKEAGILGALLFFLGVSGYFDLEPHNPYEKDDICFVRDLPGATERFTAYTPVSCADPKRVLGDAVG
ncbi:MAG TPA: hypothetical protein VLS93_02670, partial [Anaeromyxobacteraceae bacterium]|nr:hypothetical protein [Anaeromyxobacteraceae bacterium]